RREPPDVSGRNAGARAGDRRRSKPGGDEEAAGRADGGGGAGGQPASARRGGGSAGRAGGPAGEREPAPPPTTAYTTYVLWILTALNLLDYVDRYIIASVQSLVRRDFPIRDDQFGFFGTLFFIVYFATAPVFGYLGDRFPRRAILA